MPKRNVFVPYAKCSKKERCRRDAILRGSWHEINPVSKVIPSGKVYSRKKESAAMKKGWPNPSFGLGHPSFFLSLKAGLCAYFAALSAMFCKAAKIGNQVSHSVSSAKLS